MRRGTNDIGFQSKLPNLVSVKAGPDSVPVFRIEEFG